MVGEVIQCLVCARTPEQLDEYHGHGMTPLEYVIQHEGTYNPEKRLFACTECYVLLGCPSGAAPGEQWKAGNKIQAKRDLDKWADAYRCKRW